MISSAAVVPWTGLCTPSRKSAATTWVSPVAADGSFGVATLTRWLCRSTVGALFTHLLRMSVINAGF